MIAILSAFIGFCSSFIPEILHFLKDKKDKEHELKLIDMQLKALKTGHSARLEEIQIKADNDENKYLYHYAGIQTANNNNNWVDFLATSVRPMITYIFFLLYVALKIAIFIKFGASIDTIWSGEDQGIFCAVIGFWFGHRAFGRYRVNGYGNNNGYTYSNGSGYTYVNGSSNGKVNGYKY
ncbi:hypothetical protein [Candidatus Tisiphia endosymbiont of Oplodontha viridula]|uniref:hypothetical protein n=1 Tax=Candidatus Tisiphia endosymbiont of Oplodontha viridula TaxID=3077925 RepID=UPI0035C91ADA